jgi:hypothetical protein
LGPYLVGKMSYLYKKGITPREMLLAPGLPGARSFKHQKIQILKLQKNTLMLPNAYTTIVHIFNTKYLAVDEKKVKLFMFPDLVFVIFVEDII